MATTGALPVVNYTTGSQQLSQAATGQQSAMNQYNPGQLAMQDYTNQYGMNLLNGQVPQGAGLSDASRQKAWLDWNSQVAPRLAAQNGAGSPAIGSSASQLALGLAAKDSEMGFANSLGAYQAAGNFAYRPIGSNQASANNQMSNQQTSQTSTTQDFGSLLNGLLNGYANSGGGGAANTFQSPSVASANGILSF